MARQAICAVPAQGMTPILHHIQQDFSQTLQLSHFHDQQLMTNI
jgi:hypothetical protein